MLALVRTPSGATYKGVLQLEASFIDVKTCISTRTRTWVFGIALEQYSKDPDSSPGGDTCFSHQQKLLPVGGCPCKWFQKES